MALDHDVIDVDALIDASSTSEPSSLKQQLVDE